ncbi:MAG: AraC-like DNA-binding protein [Hydrogenophaga sp.]|jgi:AraC-like DNA-binding protein
MHPPPTASLAATGVRPTLRQGRAVTPMVFVQAMVSAYHARGLDPARALLLAQIAPSSVNDPNARISAAQMEVVSEAAMRELDDEALGCFRRALPWGSYGMLARASLSAPTLGLALKRWCRQHLLLTDDVRLSVQTDGDSARLVLSAHRAPQALTEFCVVSVLRNLLGFACWLVDSRIALRGAQFPYPAPRHVDAYRLLFDGPSQFDQPHAALRFDARYLALPIHRDEAAMNTMLQRALPLTVRAYRRDRLLVQRVRHALLSQPHATSNASTLAAQLNLSARTLHRQLKEEGASLQALKDTVRREIATDLLQRSQRPIKQVALSAGFQNEKSFIRAFKGWTGMTPGEWRGRGDCASPAQRMPGTSACTG